MCKLRLTKVQLERIVRALHVHGDECNKEATFHRLASNYGAADAYQYEQRACTQLARDLLENLRDR